MTTLLNIALLLLTVLLALPALVVSSECLLALLPAKRHPMTPSRQRDSVAVLIPAHNEEHAIGAAIASLLPQLHATDRVVVIADHCTDGTAEVAGAAGAVVVERNGTSARGKGHALNAGIDTLRDNPPSVVLILDADCILDAGSLDLLARTALRSGRPVQACNVMQPPGDQGIPGLISAFAFLVSNVVRPLGLARVGLPCQLMGTGMALPWQVIGETPVPTDHLVEDLQMGIDLLRQGHAAVFCHAARVTSEFPPSRHGAAMQRRRWEHGHLRTMFREVPRLLVQAVTRKRVDLLLPALDLAVPPLSLLALLLFAGLVLTTVVSLVGGPLLPAGILAIVTVYFLVGILGAWARFGRRTLPAGALLRTPIYAVMKLPVYVGFIARPEKTWQSRSERNNDK